MCVSVSVGGVECVRVIERANCIKSSMKRACRSLAAGQLHWVDVFSPWDWVTEDEGHILFSFFWTINCITLWCDKYGGQVQVQTVAYYRFLGRNIPGCDWWVQGWLVYLSDLVKTFTVTSLKLSDIIIQSCFVSVMQFICKIPSQ